MIDPIAEALAAEHGGAADEYAAEAAVFARALDQKLAARERGLYAHIIEVRIRRDSGGLFQSILYRDDDGVFWIVRGREILTSILFHVTIPIGDSYHWVAQPGHEMVVPMRAFRMDAEHKNLMIEKFPLATAAVRLP